MKPWEAAFFLGFDLTTMMLGCRQVVSSFKPCKLLSGILPVVKVLWPKFDIKFHMYEFRDSYFLV
jgi:hypothetical protein